MNKKELSNSIEELTRILKLPATRKHFKELANDASIRDISYEEYLFSLLQKECDIRSENAIKNRIRRAQYPYKKYLEDLEIEYLPEDAQKKLRMLKTLDFIKNGQNVIFAGNPGTGNYRKFLVIERNQGSNPKIRITTLISFDNNSQ